MTSLHYIAPFLCLSTFAFVILAADALFDQITPKTQAIGFWLSLVGLAAAAYLIPTVNPSMPMIFGHQLLVWDGLAYFLTWLAILTVFIVVLLSARFRDFTGLRLNAYYGLLFLASIGLVLISMSNDFLLIFLAVEMIGVPSFILVGFLRHQKRSNEAALKFFLIGAFSSAMLAYGLSILYGLTGTTSLMMIRDHNELLMRYEPLALLAVFFILVSFGFKIALVPFHMWVPDTLEGAPTPVAAFISVAPKIAGVAVALRVFSLSFPAAHLGILHVLAVLAAVTITVANLLGLRQTNVIRLMAYSSIAHMGYILLGIVAGTTAGISSVYLYGWAYLVMNLGAFAIITCVFNSTGSQDLSAYAGLNKRAPVLSALFTLFLISLAGIPPTAGFIAKFYVLATAYEGGWLWLVVLAGANTVFSVTYYFKILHAMYFKSPMETKPIEITLSTRFALALTSFFTLCIGIAPQYFLNKAEFLAGPTPAVQTEPAVARTVPSPSLATRPSASMRSAPTGDRS